MHRCQGSGDHPQQGCLEEWGCQTNEKNKGETGVAK